MHGPPKSLTKDCLYRKGVQLQYRGYFADINRWQVYVETCQLSRQRSLGWILALQAMCLAVRKLLTKRLPTPSGPTNADCFSNTPRNSFVLTNHMDLSFRRHSGIINRFESYTNRSSSCRQGNLAGRSPLCALCGPPRKSKSWILLAVQFL